MRRLIEPAQRTPAGPQQIGPAKGPPSAKRVGAAPGRPQPPGRRRSFKPGGPDGGNSRWRRRRRRRSRAHAAPRRRLRPLLRLLRRNAQRSTRTLGVGIARGRPGSRSGRSVARRRRRRLRRTLDRRPLLHPGRARPDREQPVNAVPHLAVLAAMTTGAGVVMIRLGFSEGLLKSRKAVRRCLSCDRLIEGRVCPTCTRRR
jgi:hypothetical protein